jgi:hypothetical protein
MRDIGNDPPDYRRAEGHSKAVVVDFEKPQGVVKNANRLSQTLLVMLAVDMVLSKCLTSFDLVVVLIWCRTSKKRQCF